MLKQLWFYLSIFLSFFLMTSPPKRLGLKSITNTTNLLGSPSSSDKILNNVAIILIVIYCLLTLINYFY